MNSSDAVSALGALAQATRLKIFRLLVEAGPDGLAAGRIGLRLGLASPTLSFHLKELKAAGLVSCTRAGRSLIYAADFGVMADLVGFLTDDCCGGHPQVCGLPARAATKQRGRDRAPA